MTDLGPQKPSAPKKKSDKKLFGGGLGFLLMRLDIE